MSLARRLNRKSDPYHFVRFTCEKCGHAQVHAVLRSRKTFDCGECDATHRIRAGETAETLLNT